MNRQPPITPRWKSRVLLIVVATCAALLAAEVPLRVLGYGADRGPYLQDYTGKGVHLLCYSRSANGYLDIDLADPAVRQRLYDRYGLLSMETTYRRTPYAVINECDERGMRPRPPRSRAAGTRRLVAIGDSFTYGQGLKSDDPWPRRLEALLEAEVPGGFEVVNCGVNGLNLADMKRMCIDCAMPLKPDAVVYGWCLNEPVMTTAFLEAHREVPAGAYDETRCIPGRYFSRGWITVQGPARWWAALDLVFSTANDLRRRRIIPAFYNGLYGAENADGWSASQDLLRSLSRMCGDQGATLHVAIWPILTDLGSRYRLAPAHQAVFEACRRMGIPCVDLRDRLSACPEALLTIHPNDWHPSVLASRVGAETIRDHLRRQHPSWFTRHAEGG
jgi:hypothetical protein